MVPSASSPPPEARIRRPCSLVFPKDALREALSGSRLGLLLLASEMRPRATRVQMNERISACYFSHPDHARTACGKPMPQFNDKIYTKWDADNVTASKFITETRQTETVKLHS